MIRVRLRPGPDGQRRWLTEELVRYSGPLDLEQPAPTGNRAVDSPLVVHNGDGWPTSFAYTLRGSLGATDPTELRKLYFRLKRDLRLADQVWRYEYWLPVAFGIPGGSPEPDRGQTDMGLPLIFAVTDLRWRDSLGRVVG